MSLRPLQHTQDARKPPEGGFLALGHKARMHQLLCGLHSSFGGFSSSVGSGFGSIGSACSSGVSSSTGSSFDRTGNSGRCSSVGCGGRNGSRCGFHRCWSSSRRWCLNRCFFFFAAGGQGNSGQQAGDQEGFFHERFQWMCTKRSKTLESTKKKPESFFELDRFSLTPICKCVSRLGSNHTMKKTTVFTLIKFFFCSHKGVVKKRRL